MIKVLHEPAETRTVLGNVRWETYVDLADQRHGSIPRMFYDEGVLELMSPQRIHETIGHLIARMIEAFADFHEIEIQGVESTTFRRADLAKGFEADKSYYIIHADKIRAKDRIDLSSDAPPDLVVEVEITSSAIDRMSLFAAMRIPEVWRHDGDQLTMARLTGNSYEVIAESECLRGLGSEKINSFLDQRKSIGETLLISMFRQALGSNQDSAS